MVMPTGSGKTEVALQHTLHLLKADPGARVVFLVPNNALASQQAGMTVTFSRPIAGMGLFPLSPVHSLAR